MTNIILIQLYRMTSAWCFAFSHTSTFELISSVATVRPGAVVTKKYLTIYLFYPFILRTRLVYDVSTNLELAS